MKWPSRNEVIHSAEIWARNLAEAHPQVRAVACFGSYARGDDGVGSDLDVLIVIEDGAERPGLRSAGWDQERLPVPAEVIVYTEDEWLRAGEENRRFYRTIEREAVWLWTDPEFDARPGPLA